MASFWMNLYYAIALPVLFSILVPSVLDLATRQEYAVHASWNDHGLNGNGNGILISGTSSGIGKEAALLLAEKNFTVFAGVRKPAHGEALVEAAIARGISSDRLVPLILDVVNKEHVLEAREYISKWQDETRLKLIGIVNNAGISYTRPQEVGDLDEVRRMFDVNLFGAIQMSQTFIPMLRASKGRIVHISSLAGLVVAPMAGFYSSTKFGLEAIADAQRRELLPMGISVSVVEPGYVKTDIIGKDLGTSPKSNPGDSLSEEDRKLYKPYFDNFWERRRKLFEHAKGPEETSEAILSALVEKYPATRYVTGHFKASPAWMAAKLLWLAPDRLIDTVFLVLGLIKS